jgi:hypothetical protein
VIESAPTSGLSADTKVPNRANQMARKRTF